MSKFMGATRKNAAPDSLAVCADGEGESASTIVTPTVNADGSPSDPTRSANPTAAPELQPAVAGTPIRTVERYQIIAEHGRGGLGRVSRAHDRELCRDVAIKELISGGQRNEARFLREALITARLEHPSIVPIHGAGRWPDGTPFYAMKLVSGRPLRDLIAERTTVDQRIRLLHHVIAVADAIAYAHGRNIIHRDLKPANVIVGEFGETIVIDWGLAKELSTVDEPAIDGVQGRIMHGELTVAGAVLGTPTYMAPEQERGEAVDQRADVFAIGAMLWELSSLHKVPPTNLRQRHHLLRRAGIDNDLSVIIDKALDPDPSRRYVDAGALAADLKAFKSGTRISARSYSLLAMLLHWTRRHRTLAFSIVAILTLAALGIILYVSNIAAERDRVDVALARVETANNDLAAKHAELTLKHAEHLLAIDPSATIDSLNVYNGDRFDRASQLRAEAEARGVAALRATPHHDNIRWVGGRADGSIVSLSTDGTIVRTSHDQQTIVLARNVAPAGVFSYSASRAFLAYGCDPAHVCLWDVSHNTAIPISEQIGEVSLASMSFSPSGNRFGIITSAGILRVFDLTSPDRMTEQFDLNTNDGVAILFLTESSIAVARRQSLQIVRENGFSPILSVGEPYFWRASTDGRTMFLGTLRGKGFVVDVAQMNAAKHIPLCQGSITGAEFLPQGDMIAYSCREGTVGIWNLQTNKLSNLAHLEGHADSIALAKHADYLLAAGGNGTLTIIDLSTNLITTYRGHRARLTTIAPATREYPFHISADVRGSLRSWPLPSRIARIAGNLHTRFVAGFFRRQSNTLIATTFLPEITTFSPSSGIKAVGPHISDNTSIEVAVGVDLFATYGSNESIEIWSSFPMFKMNILQTHHGAISKVAFTDNAKTILTAGRDGRIIRWRSTSESEVIAELRQPITTFVQASSSRSLVAATVDGALWKLDNSGSVSLLREANSRISRMVALPNGDTIAVGYVNGDILLIDTKTHQYNVALKAPEAIRDIAITPDANIIAIAAHNDLIYVGHRNESAWIDIRFAWRTLAIRARRIAFTSDGLMLAIDTDGNVWIYSTSRGSFVCIPTGIADLRVIAIADSNDVAAVLDTDGRIVWIDLEMGRAILNKNDKHPT
jgi:serine/threonine protein kinase/WD40 repeat protein